MTNVHEDPEILTVFCPECHSSDVTDSGGYDPNVGEMAHCWSCENEFVVAEDDFFTEREHADQA